MKVTPVLLNVPVEKYGSGYAQRSLMNMGERVN
jgi:hypothetical protein